jgi:SAM-dependent methyltransferase
MAPETLARLAALNRAFYAEHGEDFAATRPRLPLGVRGLLTRIPAGSRVLEVGCGDGKVGRRLVERGAYYLGVDSSPAMIARAQRLTEPWRLEHSQSPTSSIAFVTGDLLTDDFSINDVFDWVLAFAVLHHLPGALTRQRVLQLLAHRLAPGGVLAMSNWQLTRSERLRARIAPWSAVGLMEAEVEPNDFLLMWERGERRGLRYVHVLAEAEARQLAAAAGLTVTEVFSADGVSGDLAEYVVMQRRRER